MIKVEKEKIIIKFSNSDKKCLTKSLWNIIETKLKHFYYLLKLL